jgi:hypothetical protein
MALKFVGRLNRDEVIHGQMDGLFQRYASSYAVGSLAVTFTGLIAYIVAAGPPCNGTMPATACLPVDFLSPVAVFLLLMTFITTYVLIFFMKVFLIFVRAKPQENDTCIEMAADKLMSTNHLGKTSTISSSKISIKVTKVGIFGYAKIGKKVFRIFLLPYRVLSPEDAAEIERMYPRGNWFLYANQ